MTRVEPLPNHYNPCEDFETKRLRAWSKQARRLVLALENNDLETALSMLDTSPELIMGTLTIKPLRVAAQGFHPEIVQWAWKSYHPDQRDLRQVFKSECASAKCEATTAFLDYHNQGGRLSDPVGKRYQATCRFLELIYDSPAKSWGPGIVERRKRRDAEPKKPKRKPTNGRQRH